VHGDLVGFALEVPRRDLAEAVLNLHVEPECGGERGRREHGALHGGCVDRVDALCGERRRDRVGLLLPELREYGTRDDRAEVTVNVVDGLAVPDQKESHPFKSRTASCPNSERATRPYGGRPAVARSVETG
jgi:hypothetical protein